MAITNGLRQDLGNKCWTHCTFSEQNNNVKMVDSAWFSGFVSNTNSLLDLVAISWSIVPDPDENYGSDIPWIELRYMNYDNRFMRLVGNGHYGGSDGFSKIENPLPLDSASGTARVRIHQNTYDTNGFVICIWNKRGDWSG